ncbi:TPA: BppU family phage baseplate upper protein [Clostridium perfringens]
MIIDINNRNSDFITAVEDDNNSDVYKIILVENNEVINLTDKTVKMAYVLDYTTEKDVIDMNITNPTEGEITLVISEVLTRKEGYYSCQLLILGENDYRRHSNFFKLNIRENLFSLIASDIIPKPTFSLLQEIIKKAETLNTELSTNISSGSELNSNLSENITIADPLNNSLNENIIEGKRVKSELNIAISEANNQNEHLKGSISEANDIDSSLENNISDARDINVTLNTTLEQADVTITEATQKKEELENIINEADTIDRKLKATVEDAKQTNREATFKNTELKETLRETLEVIENLDESQDIPGLNKKITDLQNGLKSNQSLEYVGSFIDCENTLESRTEGMKIKGKTVLTDDKLVSFGEAERIGDKYKITVQSHSFNFWNIDNIKEQKGLNIEVTGDNKKFTVISEADNGFYIKLHAKAKETYVFSGTIKSGRAINYRIMTADFRTLSGGVFGELGAFSISHTPSEDMDIIARIWLAKSSTPCECENFYFGLLKEKGQPYIEDRKEILISAPLRSVDDVQDIMYEDNGKVKIDRYIGQREYREDDESNRNVITDKINTVYILDKPTTEIVANCVDIDLDTFQERTYFYILNLLPGTLDFRVPSNLGTMIQNMSKEINNIWGVIDMLVAGLLDTKKELALKIIKHNLK